MLVSGESKKVEGVLTSAVTSISSVACFALACKVSWFVDTDGIDVTSVSASAALINVYTHS